MHSLQNAANKVSIAGLSNLGFSDNASQRPNNSPAKVLTLALIATAAAATVAAAAAAALSV